MGSSPLPVVTRRRSVPRWTRWRIRPNGSSTRSRPPCGAGRDGVRPRPLARGDAGDGRGCHRLHDRLHPGVAGSACSERRRGSGAARCAEGVAARGGRVVRRGLRGVPRAAAASVRDLRSRLPAVHPRRRPVRVLARSVPGDVGQPIPQPLGGRAGAGTDRAERDPVALRSLRVPGGSSGDPHDRRFDREPVRGRDRPPHEAG